MLLYDKLKITISKSYLLFFPVDHQIKFHNRILQCSFQSLSIGFIMLLQAHNVKFYLTIMSLFHFIKFFFVHSSSTAWSIIMDTVTMYCTISDRVSYRSRYDVWVQVLNHFMQSSINQKPITKFYVVCFLFKLYKIFVQFKWFAMKCNEMGCIGIL